MNKTVQLENKITLRKKEITSAAQGVEEGHKAKHIAVNMGDDSIQVSAAGKSHNGTKGLTGNRGDTVPVVAEIGFKEVPLQHSQTSSNQNLATAEVVGASVDVDGTACADSIVAWNNKDVTSSDNPAWVSVPRSLSDHANAEENQKRVKETTQSTKEMEEQASTVPHSIGMSIRDKNLGKEKAWEDAVEKEANSGVEAVYSGRFQALQNVNEE